MTKNKSGRPSKMTSDTLKKLEVTLSNAEIYEQMSKNPNDLFLDGVIALKERMGLNG